MCGHACVLSRVQLFVTRCGAHQAPLSMGFSWQEYWTGLPFSSPRDLPDPGIKPLSPVTPALARGLFKVFKVALFLQDSHVSSPYTTIIHEPESPREQDSAWIYHHILQLLSIMPGIG